MIFLRKVWHFFRRDALEALSYRTQFLLDAVQIISNCAVFFFLSRYVTIDFKKFLPLGESSIDYFPYVFIGIAAADFYNATLQSFSRGIYREMGAGTLEAILVTHTSLFEVALASFLGGVLNAAGRLGFYAVLGVYVFKITLPPVSWMVVFLVLGCTVTATMGLGLISAGNALFLKRGDPLTFVMRGLSKFLSGVYFPIAVLPGFIQSLSLCFPLTYSLKALRLCFFQHAGVSDIFFELCGLLLFSGVLVPAGILYFKWAFRKAKMEGTLNLF